MIKMKSGLTMNGVTITATAEVVCAIQWKIVRRKTAGGKPEEIKIEFNQPISVMEITGYICRERKSKNFKGYTVFDCTPFFDDEN